MFVSLQKKLTQAAIEETSVAAERVDAAREGAAGTRPTSSDETENAEPAGETFPSQRVEPSLLTESEDIAGSAPCQVLFSSSPLLLDYRDRHGTDWIYLSMLSCSFCFWARRVRENRAING